MSEKDELVGKLEPHAVTCVVRYSREEDCTCGYTATKIKPPANALRSRLTQEMPDGE